MNAKYSICYIDTTGHKREGLRSGNLRNLMVICSKLNQTSHGKLYWVDASHKNIFTNGG